jgi:hypothetical protein
MQCLPHLLPQIQRSTTSSAGVEVRRLLLRHSIPASILLFLRPNARSGQGLRIRNSTAIIFLTAGMVLMFLLVMVLGLPQMGLPPCSNLLWPRLGCHRCHLYNLHLGWQGDFCQTSTATQLRPRCQRCGISRHPESFHQPLCLDQDHGDPHHQRACRLTGEKRQHQ